LIRWSNFSPNERNNLAFIWQRFREEKHLWLANIKTNSGEETKNVSDSSKITVSIYNEDYVVKGNENGEYIHMLAAYVDHRMKMLGQRNSQLSTTKIAVLTALNLADELNKLQEDYDELTRVLEEEKKNRMG